jgi:hypothetical protein
MHIASLFRLWERDDEREAELGLPLRVLGSQFYVNIDRF